MERRWWVDMGRGKSSKRWYEAGLERLWVSKKLQASGKALKDLKKKTCL